MENDQSRLECFISMHVLMQIEKHREQEANYDGKSDDDNFSLPTQVALEDDTYPAWANRDNLMPPSRSQPLPDGMKRQPGTGAPVVNNEQLLQLLDFLG
jgi:hypothetical protein